RVGRKPMVLRAMLSLSLANFLMGFSQSAVQLLLFRFFQGCLSGFLAPSLALMTSCAPPEKTGYALGTLQTSLITGLIAGPLLGGVLAHFMGSRLVFFWTGFFCLCGALIVFRFVLEEFDSGRKEQKSGLRQNLGSVFNSVELRKMFFVLILIQFAINFIVPFLTLYVEFLKVPQDYLSLVSGAVFGVTGITSAVTAPLWGRKADETGYYRVLRFAIVGMVVFMLPQAFVANAVQLLLLRAGLGIFVSGTIPVIYSIIRQSTREEARGGIYGIFQSGILLGNMIGPLAGGGLAALLGLRNVFLASGFILCFALLSGIVQDKK
ncbi:MAG TPA: MFS transporter, partial [Syntrophales bacterium]|nr:MFS transporter [Syntrophales bacterium]